MAGLSDFIQNKETATTTMPSWYSSAQQNLVNQATGAAAAAPSIQNTAAQTAVNTFGAGSPFAAGQSILESIGSGAVNPWLVSTDATGAQTVTPNVATPLGGLFAAQQDYLGKMMPGIEAARTAQSIAGGDFGSRMNLSGIAAERGKAMSDLAQKQMQAALQAQQYGVAAGAGLGNIGQEQVKSALETGTFQQNAPFAGQVNLANILGKIQPGQTVEKNVQLSPLNQLLGLLSGGSGVLDALQGKYVRDAQGNIVRLPGLLEKSGISGGVSNLFGSIFGTRPTTPTTQPTLGTEATGWTSYFDPGTGFVWYQDPGGDYVGVDANNNYYDTSGNIIWSPEPWYWGGEGE